MKVEVQKILISVLQNSAPNSVMKFLHLSHVSRINIFQYCLVLEEFFYEICIFLLHILLAFLANFLILIKSTESKATGTVVCKPLHE